MERLTNKKEADVQRQEYENRLRNGYPRSIPEERFLRLAAYEDTGLEPEEIMGLCSIHERVKMAEMLRMEENRPLTLDELREMVGQWVWVEVQYARTKCDGWAFVPTPAYIAYLDKIMPLDFSGKRFVAYRRKPEEGTE